MRSSAPRPRRRGPHRPDGISLSNSEAAARGLTALLAPAAWRAFAASLSRLGRPLAGPSASISRGGRPGLPRGREAESSSSPWPAGSLAGLASRPVRGRLRLLGGRGRRPRAASLSAANRRLAWAGVRCSCLINRLASDSAEIGFSASATCRRRLATARGDNSSFSSNRSRNRSVEIMIRMASFWVWSKTKNSYPFPTARTPKRVLPIFFGSTPR